MAPLTMLLLAALFWWNSVLAVLNEAKGNFTASSFSKGLPEEVVGVILGYFEDLTKFGPNPIAKIDSLEETKAYFPVLYLTHHRESILVFESHGDIDIQLPSGRYLTMHEIGSYRHSQFSSDQICFEFTVVGGTHCESALDTYVEFEGKVDKILRYSFFSVRNFIQPTRLTLVTNMIELDMSNLRGAKMLVYVPSDCNLTLSNVRRQVETRTTRLAAKMSVFSTDLI